MESQNLPPNKGPGKNIYSSTKMVNTLQLSPALPNRLNFTSRTPSPPYSIPSPSTVLLGPVVYINSRGAASAAFDSPVAHVPRSRQSVLCRADGARRPAGVWRNALSAEFGASVPSLETTAAGRRRGRGGRRYSHAGRGHRVLALAGGARVLVLGDAQDCSTNAAEGLGLRGAAPAAHREALVMLARATFAL